MRSTASTGRRPEWVKAHLCVGTKTQVVTAVFMDEKNSGDCPQFDPLTKATAESFAIEEMSADKAYLSNDNLELIDRDGRDAVHPVQEQFPAGRVGSLASDVPLLPVPAGGIPDALPPPSLVESAFSMIKRKFGDAVRAKTDAAMRNEALAKILCHNIACCISAWYELKIDPMNWMRRASAGRRRAAGRVEVPRAVGVTRFRQGNLMPHWMMRAYAALLMLLGSGLGVAASLGQFGWWSPALVPVALLFAGLIGVMASDAIRRLEQRVRAMEERQRPQTPGSYLSLCERTRRFCRPRPPTYNRTDGTAGLSRPTCT